MCIGRSLHLTLQSFAVLLFSAVLLASCGWSSLSEAATGNGESVELGEEQSTTPEQVNAPDQGADVAAEPVSETSTTSTSTTTTTAPTTTTTTTPRLFYDMIAPAGTSSTWSGSIGSGEQPREINISLAEQGDFILGEITFADNGTTRTLAGTRLGEGVILREFAQDGRVLRTFTATSFWNGNFEELAAGNAPVNITLDGIIEDEAVFSGGISDGSYRYAFGPFEGENLGPFGDLSLTNVTANSGTVEILALTGGPAYNHATITPTEVAIFGRAARYEEQDDWLDCSFDIVAFGDVIFVEYINERWDCGFGHNASVAGVYVRTSS